MSVECPRKASCHPYGSVDRSATTVGNAGLISYAFDEELGAIGFVEEFAALLKNCQRGCFVSCRGLMRAYLDDDGIQGGRRASEKQSADRQ